MLKQYACSGNPIQGLYVEGRWEYFDFVFHVLQILPLEESLSITTIRCDLVIATHARKMHKKIIFVVIHLEVLDEWLTKILQLTIILIFVYAFS